MRSGQFIRMNTSDVREGELKHRDILTGELEFETIQDEKQRKAAKIIGYVSYFKLVNGFEKSMYMNKEELNAHGGKFSKTFKYENSLWKTDFDSMAKKTVLKLLLGKFGPLSIDTSMQLAVSSDQATINDPENIEDITYVDNSETKVDPDLERQRLLLNNLKTQEDFDFARSMITDKVILADLDLMEIEFKKGK